MDLPHARNGVEAYLYSPFKPFRLEHFILDHFHYFNGRLLEDAQDVERGGGRKCGKQRV